MVPGVAAWGLLRVLVGETGSMTRCRLYGRLAWIVIVSLLTPGKPNSFSSGREGESAAIQKIRYVSFPIADRDVPESVHDSLALFHDLAHELTNGRNVAVHCRQGIGRSALVAAGTLIVSGVIADKALAAVREARGLDVPETAAQREWVEQLSAGVLR